MNTYAPFYSEHSLARQDEWLTSIKDEQLLQEELLESDEEWNPYYLGKWDALMGSLPELDMLDLPEYKAGYWAGMEEVASQTPCPAYTAAEF